jgi:hypothetical protein
LGGIKILETDGRKFDPTIGDPSREDWYNRRTGFLYISHFKTDKSAMGTPYEFQLEKEVRDAIEVTLAPGAPEANRPYLLNIGVDKEGRPEPVGKKIKLGFTKAGLIYKKVKSGELKNHVPGVLEIRHAQVMFKYREYKARYNSMTETQISERIAIFFNHSSDISRGYKRLTFDSLSDPLATKRGVTSSTRETPRTAAPAALLDPIEEGGGDSEGGGESSGGPPPPPPPPARKPPVPKARRAARKAAKAPAPQRKPPPAKKPPVAQPPPARPAPQPQRQAELASRRSERGRVPPHPRYKD